MMPADMINPKIIDDLNARIVSFLQHTPGPDVAQNMKALLTASFAKLDLVTREQFDLQAQVLARTREKLVALEARIAELERANAPRQ